MNQRQLPYERAWEPARAVHPVKKRTIKPPVERSEPLPAKGAPDGLLLLIILVLVLFGLVMLFSASFYTVQESGKMPWATVGKQAIIAGLGLGAMILAMNVPFTWYKKDLIVYGAVGLSIALLGLVLIFGEEINYSRRWFLIPGINISVQPGEIAKLALVLFMAYRMANRRKEVITVKGLIIHGAVVGIMFLLVMQQPNLSTAASLVLLCGIMLWCGGAKVMHLGVLVILGGILVYQLAHSADYRLSRMLSYQNPFAPEYVKDEGYQLAQSLLSLGSGGVWGVGLGHSRQKLLFLPYADSDFIFAIIGEEIGLVGCIVVIALFFALVYLGMRVAVNCRDRFGSLLAAGLSALIGVQVFLNVAVVTGLLPTTGLPLPFFSAGGTSLIIIMGAMGMLLNISRYAKRPEKKIAET